MCWGDGNVQTISCIVVCCRRERHGVGRVVREMTVHVSLTVASGKGEWMPSYGLV